MTESAAAHPQLRSHANKPDCLTSLPCLALPRSVHAVYCCQEQGQRAAPSPAPEVALFSADPPPNAGGP